MCTHNQCFRAKKEKHHDFSSENYPLYIREKLQYITWACFRNVSLLGWFSSGAVITSCVCADNITLSLGTVKPILSDHIKQDIF